MSDRMPPHNTEAERALIGSAMFDNDVILSVKLSPADFYNQSLGQVWGAIVALVNGGKAADLITMDEVIKKRKLSVTIPDLIGMTNEVPTALNAPDYAAIIKANAQRRALIKLSTTTANSAYDEAGAVDGIINQAERGLIEIRQNETVSHLTRPPQNASTFIDELQSEETTTVPTYYRDFDRLIGGLEQGSLYWFPAAEKMGKTSFVSRISLHNALNGRVVIRFSLEMSAKQRTRRDISMMTGIPITKLKRRDLTAEEMQRAFDAAGRLSQSALIIDQTPGVTPSQMRATINRVLLDYGRLDLIELDYFQLGDIDKPTANRVSDLETYSRNIAHIAREYSVPFIGTAQVLSKSIEQRGDKRPYLSDVFGSSALAKDGYMIAFIYRDEYYNPDTTERPNQGELIIRAHRDGDTPTIRLYFDGPTAQYRDLQLDSVNL
jgi:replicative DNA helicase